jgi:hypothetical protein
MKGSFIPRILKISLVPSLPAFGREKITQGGYYSALWQREGGKDLIMVSFKQSLSLCLFKDVS